MDRLQCLLRETADLRRLTYEFPAFRIWREVMPGRQPRYVAQRLRDDVGPHTVITPSLTELREVLSNSSDQLTLTGIQREFPGWEVWRGISGRYYARRVSRPRAHSSHVESDDLLDLRDRIIRWIGFNEEQSDSR
jgi:hypothetical protein